MVWVENVRQLHNLKQQLLGHEQVVTTWGTRFFLNTGDGIYRECCGYSILLTAENKNLT